MKFTASYAQEALPNSFHHKQSINANRDDAHDNFMTKITRIHYLCKTRSGNCRISRSAINSVLESFGEARERGEADRRRRYSFGKLRDE